MTASPVLGQTADLTVLMESPDGTIVELFSAVGGGSDNLTDTTLDDEAARPISAGTGPFRGRFQPEGKLANFRGKDITGTWTLRIGDQIANQHFGALLGRSFTVDLATDPPGNVNHDSHLGANDIDVLFANLGLSDPTFDLNGDGVADQRDARRLVEDLMGRRFGDGNLDQKIDIEDVNIVIANFDPLGTNPHNGWGQGDFDGDGDVDITDFLKVALNFAPGGYPAPVTMDEMSLSETESKSTSATLSKSIDAASYARPPEASLRPTSEVDILFTGANRKAPRAAE